MKREPSFRPFKNCPQRVAKVNSHAQNPAIPVHSLFLRHPQLLRKWYLLFRTRESKQKGESEWSRCPPLSCSHFLQPQLHFLRQKGWVWTLSLEVLQGCRILAWIDIRGDCGIDVSVASSGLVWPSARLIQWPVITGSYRSQVSPGRERGSLDLRAFPLIKTQTGIRPRNRWIPSSFLRLSKGRTTFPHWRD